MQHQVHKTEVLTDTNIRGSNMKVFSEEEYIQYKKDKKKKELQEKVKNGGVLTEDEYREYKGLPPVTQEDETTKSSKRTWFSKGAFEDGYQFGDILKTGVGTATDISENLTAGVLGMGEKIVDAGAYVVGGVGGLFGNDKLKNEMAQFMAKDLYDEQKLAESRFNPLKGIIGIPLTLAGKEADDWSILGEKADSLVQSAGQLAATIGLQYVGVPWWLTTGVTSFGGEVDEAFNEGASYLEAGISGAITAGLEVGLEKLSGGIKFGGATADEGLKRLISKSIENKLVKTAMQFGLDVVGEGAEEVLTEFGSEVGRQLTYKKEEEFKELLSNEEAMDKYLAQVGTALFGKEAREKYLEAGIGGGVLGGGINVASAVKSVKTGRDYNTGLSDNEQSIVDSEVQRRIEEQETGEKKLSKKERNQIEQEVLTELKRGEIDTDTIERTFGGDKYSALDSLKKESEEFNTLFKTKKGDLSREQELRLEELEKKNSEKSYSDRVLEAQSQLSQVVNKATENDVFLKESFAEKGRKSEAFQLTEEEQKQFSEEEMKIVNKAVENGEINNTRKAHDMVSFVAKVSAQLKTDFDFTNNKKLAEAGFLVEGKNIDGFKQGNSITVNLQSKKALNTVVGHEITHVLEGTNLYDALQGTLKEYATSKGVYDSMFETAKENYKNVYTGLTEAEYNAKIEQEVTADLVGEYIFSDMDFVRNLSTKNPNVFQKVYNEIKYMLKVATTGSDVEKQLLKAKKIFEDVYRDTKRNTSEEVQYAVANNGKKSYNATKNKTPNLTEQVIRKHYDTKQTEFFVNDFNNYYRVKMGEELSYEIVDTIKIDGNEDYIKSLEREWKNEFNTGRKDIAPYNANLENSKGYGDSIDVTTQGQQSWAEYFDELLEKFKSEGIDRGSYNTESGGNNSIAPTKTPNNGVFFDGKTQFSVSDNKGNAVSPAMQKRLANTKAVDENGDLKVLYHGTPNGEFTIFDKSKGSVEGDFGSGFYFTDNESDVETNYEGGGPDFENKVSRRAEQIEQEQDIDYDEAEKIAREELYVGSNKFEVYLNIENPAIVGETLLLEQDAYLEQYDESDFEDYDEYFAEVEQLFADDVESIIWDIEQKIDLYGDTSGIAGVLYDAYYEGGIDISDLKERINELYLEDTDGNFVGNEVTRQIIESLGYDGIIDSTVSSKFSNMGLSEDTTHYIVFKPNQIKSITNQNPTDNPDINLSLTDNSQKLAPIKNGIYSEDVMLERPIAPLREDVAKTNEIDVTGMTTRMKESEIEMQNEMFPPMTEEDANNMLNSEEDWDRLRKMQEAQEPQEIVDDTVYPMSDTARLSEADLREVRKSIKDKLPLQRGRTQEFNDIIQRYSTSEYPNLDALFYEIKDNFGKVTVTEEISEIIEVQKLLKDTRIDVSESIKKGVTDYVQTMRRNAFKLRFSKDGMPVDVVYQELSEMHPNMFPEDITNEIDQFEQIVSVANMMRTETGEFEIDNETIYDTVNSIVNTVRDIRTRLNQNTAERRARWFDKDRTLEEYMQTDDFAELAGNPNLLKVFQERWDRNRLGTEPPKVDETVAQIRDTEPQAEKKGFREDVKRKWAVFKANFVDKGAVFEDLAKVTKNRSLEAKWDYTMLSDAQAQNFMQNGFEGSKALKDIREEVENTGFSKEFSEYMYHYLNIDRMTLDARYGIENKTVFGQTITADVSKQKVSELESAHPEFKAFAQDVYNYMGELRNRLVQNGVLSQETADLWAEMYPHYVPIRRVDSKGMNVNVPLATDRTGVNAPIKRATGGNSDILPLFDTMAQRTMQTFKAINKNDFGIELKNTLGSTIGIENSSVDGSIDMVENQEALLQAGEHGYNPTFTVFEDGKRVTFEITQEMYEALLPMSDKMRDSGSKILQKASSFHRGVLTEYNPVFALTNGIKDLQDILINSQHPLKTYAKIVEATQQLLNKGEWYQEYMRQGGEDNSYFDTDTNMIAPIKKGVLNTFPLKAISDLNNFIERVPRLAEYIASREMGRSVQESMLDASRVTTNFKAGGDVTKFLNRNGATFLNASVQGVTQQVRNVREAKMNGFKGWAMLATKFAVAGLPALLLNHLLWDDDEEYEELSDYVKQNYYVVGKTEDGHFIRIPKGRTVAVIQEAVNQMDKAATGDDSADLKTFLEVLANNLAPNNPISNNVIAPIVQAATNKTWYGGELVPQSLQDLPSAEQYDESTDSMSKAIGKAFNVSPMKVNYLLDQYTGLVGDMVLPALTPEVTSGSDGALGYALAPLKDKFMTDGVMNKQVITDFYDKSDELTMNAKKSTATSEDILKNKYLNSIKGEMNELYKQKREIQNSALSNKEKYDRVREIQSQISALAQEGMNNYESVEVYDFYGNVYDRHYRLNDDGEWLKITDEQFTKQLDVTNALGITANDYWSNKEEYDYAYDQPGKYGVAKAVGGYETFKVYREAFNLIESDKNKIGQSISGSRKRKVVEFLNSLETDYYTKLIMLKYEYPAEDRYNGEIIDYLNSREDLSYQETVEILTELGFKVTEDGTVRW